MITRMYVKIYLHLSYSNNIYQPCVELWHVHVVHLAQHQFLSTQKQLPHFKIQQSAPAVAGNLISIS